MRLGRQMSHCVRHDEYLLSLPLIAKVLYYLTPTPLPVRRGASDLSLPFIRCIIIALVLMNATHFQRRGVAPNLQGLFEVRYTGDALDGNTTIKLLEAINDIKNQKLPEESV